MAGVAVLSMVLAFEVMATATRGWGEGGVEWAVEEIEPVEERMVHTQGLSAVVAAKGWTMQAMVEVMATEEMAATAATGGREVREMA